MVYLLWVVIHDVKIVQMKKYFLSTFILFSVLRITSQDKILISENEGLKFFETYLSLNSNGNVCPTIYGEGLIYASTQKNNNYYFSDLKSKSIKLRTGSKNPSGPVAIFNSEIYFTGLSKSKNAIKKYNFTIYKGVLKGFKVVNIQTLPILKLDCSYTDPSISKDGKRMVVVSNEKGYPHLLELNRNNNNEWVKGNVIFISNPQFEILNPTIYDENTIYFSSNISSGKIEEVKYTSEDGIFLMSRFNVETSDFNIYKTVKNNGIWQLPLKEAMFNSEFDDLGVLFKTKTSGYINSFRYSNTDNIYYFELKD